MQKDHTRMVEMPLGGLKIVLSYTTTKKIGFKKPAHCKMDSSSKR
jgi:hypothetical protein